MILSILYGSITLIILIILKKLFVRYHELQILSLNKSISDSFVSFFEKLEIKEQNVQYFKIDLVQRLRELRMFKFCDGLTVTLDGDKLKIFYKYRAPFALSNINMVIHKNPPL